MYKWFKSCKYAEEGKKLYHELVKKFHTDNGGTDETVIKEINIEFSAWWKDHKNLHYSADKHEEYTQETEETAEEFIEIISKLSHMQGIAVELCGTWLWITGNTYPYREELKVLGARFSSTKKAWYYACGLGRKHRGTKTMKQIRLEFGSRKMKLDKQLYLA